MKTFDIRVERPDTAPIGVYISHYNIEFLDSPGYGAFIYLPIGERVLVKTSKTTTHGILQSELRWHEEAPVIDSARGRGKWIYEVDMEDSNRREAVSAVDVYLPDEKIKSIKLELAR